MRRWLLLLLVATPTLLHGQAPDQKTVAFDVASVKPNDSGSNGVAVLPAANGGWRARNIPLGFLIRLAYQVQDNQIVGGPSWLFQDRFDVVGTGSARGRDGSQMDKLKTLLAERFHLTIHVENREMPVYELVLGRSDGKLGEKLTPSAVDCVALSRAVASGTKLPPAPGQFPTCGFARTPGTLMVGGQTMAAFAENLSPLVGRVVLNRTTLAGTYDVTLSFTPDSVVGGRGDLPLVNGASPVSSPDAVSIFQGIQEQLGLKLEPTKAPVYVLVIDHVEKPTPD